MCADWGRGYRGKTPCRKLAAFQTEWTQGFFPMYQTTQGRYVFLMCVWLDIETKKLTFFFLAQGLLLAAWDKWKCQAISALIKTRFCMWSSQCCQSCLLTTALVLHPFVFLFFPSSFSFCNLTEAGGSKLRESAFPRKGAGQSSTPC